MSNETTLAQASTEASPEASPEAETATTETVEAQETTTPAEASAETEPKGEETTEAKASEDSEEGNGEEPAAIELKFEDGVEVDQAAVEKALPVMQELGLTQEQAQGVANLYAQMQAESMNQLGEQVAAQAEAWENQIKEDWGKDFDANLQTSAKGIDYFDKLLRESLPEADRIVEIETKDGKDRRLATPFRDALNETGAGNHPALAKVLLHFSELLGEDDIAQTVRAQTGPRDVAASWYGNDGRGASTQ